MISYALSTSAFGGVSTPECINALRQSKFRKFEMCFGVKAFSEEVQQICRNVRQLVKEGVMDIASIHMPFHNGTEWDASYPDEDIRKKIVANHVKLLRDNADIAGKLVTIHASGEPPMEEHPVRMEMIHRTLAELMPVAEEMDLTLNIEFLPRTCLGNCVEELQQIIADFDPARVGICLDVNHIMTRYRELPDIIAALAPRINSFHICDYDGVDETHWMPGQGVYNWAEILTSIRKIDHDVLLILETEMQLKRNARQIDPIFALRQNERACWFMENFARLNEEISSFVIPGN